MLRTAAHNIKATILAFSARAGIYLAGFVFNFVIANALSPSEFGAFSTTMAASEFLAIVLTLGSSLIIYRDAYEKRSVPAYSIGGVLLAGAATVGIFYIPGLTYFPEAFSHSPYALATAAGLSLSALLLQSLRALAWIKVFMYEQLIRQFLYIFAVFAAWLASTGSLDLKTAFWCMIFGSTTYAGIILILVIAKTRANYSSSRSTPSDYLLMLFSAICSYVSRKGDILLLSALLSAPIIASVKIALLISEIPFQFIQNLYFQSADLFNSTGDASTRQLRQSSMIQLAFWSAILSAGALISLPIFSTFIWPKLDFARFVSPLLIYYLMRSLLIPVEQRLVMDHRPRLLISITFLSAITKVLFLTLAVYKFELHGFNVYPIIGLVELILVEIAFRISFRESYLRWCFGAR